MNPDTYEFLRSQQNHTEDDAYFIKNQLNIGWFCYNKFEFGINLKNNYNTSFALNNNGSSDDPCMYNYRGRSFE